MISLKLIYCHIKDNFALFLSTLINPSYCVSRRFHCHSQPLFNVVASFEEVAPAQTKVTFRQIFETVKECEKIKPHVEDKNEENMDKLDKELLLLTSL